MSEHQTSGDADRTLWQRHARAQGSSGNRRQQEPVSSNLLAAYMEGRATDNEVEQVERALADDPELLDGLIDVRRVLAEVPVDAATSYTMADRIRSTLRQEHLVGGHPFGRSWIWTGLAAAALMLACSLGYILGAAIGGTTSPDEQLAEQFSPEGADASVTSELMAAFSDAE